MKVNIEIDEKLKEDYIQALRLLESLTSREYVLSLMDEDVTEKVTFFTYPTGEEYQLKLRYKVNQKISELTKL